VQNGTAERLERQVEADDRRRRIAVDTEAIFAHRMDHEVVAVDLVALGRGSTHETESSAVVADVEGRRGEGGVGRAGASGQLGHVGGDVNGRPVPEPRDDRRIGIEAGHDERLSSFRSPTPRQMR